MNIHKNCMSEGKLKNSYTFDTILNWYFTDDKPYKKL